MITQEQIEASCKFIKSVIPDVAEDVSYEIQDKGMSIIFFVEILRELSANEELICEVKLKELSKLLPVNKARSSPMVSCVCRQGYGEGNYSFIGFK